MLREGSRSLVKFRPFLPLVEGEQRVKNKILLTARKTDLDIQNIHLLVHPRICNCKEKHIFSHFEVLGIVLCFLVWMTPDTTGLLIIYAS